MISPETQKEATQHVLKQAFLRGAGVAPGAIGAELTADMMQLPGKIMAASLQGGIDLPALRKLVKQEVHAGFTTVLVRNNNPLPLFGAAFLHADATAVERAGRGGA